MDTLGLLREARETFVDGHHIATLLLAISFIEHTIAEELQLRSITKDSLIFQNALKAAAEHKVFPQEWIERTEKLRLLRNPFAHLKDLKHEHTIGSRYRKKQVHPATLLETDAKESLELMYKYFAATLRADA